MRQLVSFIVCFCVLSTVGLAQPLKKGVPNLPNFDDRPLHFGFYIGFNAMDFRVVHKEPGLIGDAQVRYADVVSLNPGINIGMVTSFRLNQYFNLRILPGISFGQRDLLFISEDGEKDRLPLEVKSTFIESPILIKFNGARMTNAKPFLITGINPRFDLAKSKKDGIMMRPFDLYWEIGGGIDSYMSYFRFATELKLSVGLLNVLNPSGTGEPEDVLYTHVLDRVTSRIFVLTFYFE